MIEREFYVEARFENLARLLESVTSRYHGFGQVDVVQLGKRTYITLQGAIPDYTRGSITITGAQVTEDDDDNVVLIHPNLPMIEFHTVAVRETRLKVTARCGFENIMLERFRELLEEIEKAYPEARIEPLAFGIEAEKESTMYANSPLPDYKRRALEERRAALVEEYEAANAQLSRELADVNRKRIERQIADLERQIAEIEVQLQGAPAPPTPASATPPGPEPPALQMARRALAHLEMQAGAYTVSTTPVHLQIDLEEKRKQVEELESRWRAGEL